jgi:2-methylisocitrate lyase-like PEP mutase family enzyme
MNQTEKADYFGTLHRKGTPVILYNIWDAGTAKAVTEAGAKALATGSWSVAAANGYGDGQKLPMDVLIETARTITAVNDLPLSVDFEGGYSTEPAGAAANVAKLIEAGAIGINFEDQRVGEAGLHSIEAQAARIRAIREMAKARGIDFFINARTDIFLQEGDGSRHAGLVDAAIERGKAYAAAGASGFFVPGLIEPALIGKSLRRILAAGQYHDEGRCARTGRSWKARCFAHQLWSGALSGDDGKAEGSSSCDLFGQLIVAGGVSLHGDGLSNEIANGGGALVTPGGECQPCRWRFAVKCDVANTGNFDLHHFRRHDRNAETDCDQAGNRSDLRR